MGSYSIFYDWSDDKKGKILQNLILRNMGIISPKSKVAHCYASMYVYHIISIILIVQVHINISLVISFLKEKRIELDEFTYKKIITVKSL